MREAVGMTQASRNASRAATAFSAQDRKLMLSTTGVGACMVQRLEDAGFSSIAQMHALGAQHVVMAMCEFVGDDAWANRRRAIQRVIDHADATVLRRDTSMA
jgi:predicted secreted protein